MRQRVLSAIHTQTRSRRTPDWTIHPGKWQDTKVQCKELGLSIVLLLVRTACLPNFLPYQSSVGSSEPSSAGKDGARLPFAKPCGRQRILACVRTTYVFMRSCDLGFLLEEIR